MSAALIQQGNQMTIKLYWWRGEGAQDPSKQNFGDYLSPLIVEMVSGRKVIYAEPANADMIAIGSILSRERKAKGILFKRHLHIWGSGTDKSTRTFSNRHTYHAVRGTITRSQIPGLRQSPALGDPGLLADRWWGTRPKPRKTHRVGIIPHFVDQQDPRFHAIAKLDSVKAINVFSPIEEVLSDILRCEFILSSSMHGLIIADAFSIPNRRIHFSTGIISDLKFDDYYSALGMSSPEPVSPDAIIQSGLAHAVFNEDYQRPGIEQVKDDLTSAFPTF